MNTKSKILLATTFVIALAAPAFADEPESLVSGAANLTISRSSEPVLMMQATPVQYRNQAPAPRQYDYNSDYEGQYDHAKGNIH
jgi:hypothetical protein